MDTRNKIVQFAPEPPPAVAVTGYFDVLQPWHIAELERIRARAQPLAVVVLPLADQLLSQRARAELVASLRMVDYVLTPNDGHLESTLAQLAPAEIVRLDERDLVRRGELIAHVRQRQNR